jgi:hypothetical protein
MKMNHVHQKNSSIKIQKGYSKLLVILLTILTVISLSMIILISKVEAFSRLLLMEQKPNRTPYNEQILIERIHSDPRGGQAYRLTYTAPVSIDVYWRFKTDFDNDFLKDNKFILSHRFVSRNNNTVITENEYTNKPKVVFRWKTNFSYENLRLDFVLLNPEETGHDFHYGHILLNPKGDSTQIVQEAYFNFFGASFWAIYPWSGGMAEFLKYNAQWEYDMVLKLYDQYAG